MIRMRTSGKPYRAYEASIQPAVLVASGGPITVLNARLSTVEGNAFIWLSGVDLSAYQDGNHLICLYNITTAPYCAMGFISASAPAGESLGDELVVDGGFSDADSWECMTGVEVSGGKALGVAPAGHSEAMWNDLGAAQPVGTLYKVVYTIDAWVGGGNMLSSLNMLADETDTTSWVNTAGTKTEYVIRKNAENQPGLYFIPTLTLATCDDFSIKPVTDPPNTAVKIVNTKGGAVRNFLYMHEDFNPYDYNGQNYKIYDLGA